jgi:ABC-2 type transport system ATP-binding protein
MSETICTVRGLEVVRDGFHLGPLDLELPAGRVLGLIGPNGAGKTTALQAMAGLLRPDGGSIEVMGRRAAFLEGEWKQPIGYVPDDPLFYERWSGRRNLEFVAGFYPDWDDDYARILAHRFDLDLDREATKLSRGNRVKLALVMALAHRPRLCLFDEATNGLDPLVRQQVFEALYDVLEGGDTAILFSTHILADLAALADELAFLANGRIVFQGPKDIIRDTWRRISFRWEGELPRLPGVISRRRERRTHLVVTTDREATLASLRELGAEGLETAALSLDEIAVEVLKGGVHADAAAR